jgi:hypothetical protein
MFSQKQHQDCQSFEAIMVVVVVVVEIKHLNVTQTISEQHIGKARHQGTTKNSHVAHCTHTA